jgi:crossover junction endodeoxyribonuclease RusA
MPAYLAWEKLAGTKIKDSHRIGFTSYTLHICLRRPDLKRSRDLGNYEKCLSDMLVSHGVVADDSCCERLLMTWDQGMAAECVVIIQQAEESLAA